MTPDSDRPLEPAPRLPEGPPAFVPPPHAPLAAGAAGGKPPWPYGAPPPVRRPVPRAWRAALLAGGVALAFYVWGAAPSVLPGDSAELAATAFRGGVPRPTGYPTFVLLGRLAGAVLPGDPAHRITLMCAISGAVSVTLFALLLAELGVAWGAVLAGALFYAGTFTLWWSAIRVEVYAPAIALALFALWRVMVARRTLAARDGLLAAFALGLALTGHMSFAPLLALAGLALFVRTVRAGALSLTGLVGAVVFLAFGLTPYLYLVQADRQFTLTNHLYYAIEPAGGQLGLSPERFDETFERMRFLLLGSWAPMHDLAGRLPAALSSLGIAWARVAAFEVGPLGILLAMAGEGALAGRDRGAARLLAGIALVTPLLGALVVEGALLSVCMMATTISVSALAACGIDSLLARGGTRASLAVAFAIAALLVPHELRVRANTRPLGAPWMRMEEAGPPHITTFVPQLREARETRTTAERTLAAIPESSFVAGHWDDVMPLKYLQSAEGRRPDLTLDPWTDPAHLVRIARWMREHALATHPVVVVGRVAGLDERLAAPQVKWAGNSVTLLVERSAVDTTRAGPAGR